VARRIWSVAMREFYGANRKSQRLKYHIQTSGRSLHAQEIQFNDIRTTLQALIAIFDNCNSLHTNAYDEAITTPTEESVRRAMAIQMIINEEFGLAKNENPYQGSFVVEELTDLVEEAVLSEFDRLSRRGGVLGAMERQYQRNKIQDESLKYEKAKHSGERPIIGVNTFEKEEDETLEEEQEDLELVRSTEDEKKGQIEDLRDFQEEHSDETDVALERLKQVVLDGGNIFAELMHTTRVASLGQITHALYEVGGEYRRSM
jgi:methylmalonyl-CoA mutase